VSLLFAWRERLCDFLGDLWYRLDRRHREIVRRNLAFAYGRELPPAARERLARAVFQQFVRFGLEVLELAVLPRSIIRKKVVITGLEHVQAALREGKGLVVIGAHAGNWEYTAAGFVLQYQPVAVVARELSQPWLRPLARRLRERDGNLMISKRGGLKEILSHLKHNRIVGIIIDQNTAAGEGLLVEFFGHPARTTPVAALLARRRGVPVLPGFSRRLPDGRHLLAFLPPLPLERSDDVEGDIRRHLQAQSRAVEAWVRAAPEQWLWLHRRWKNQFPELYEGV
jgi:KDO2-lipid IV(A) lauroyltransferase